MTRPAEQILVMVESRRVCVEVCYLLRMHALLVNRSCVVFLREVYFVNEANRQPLFVSQN